MEEEQLNEDKLYLALTRPAMVPGLGVPVEAFTISLIFSGLVMIIADSIFYLVIALPLLAICRIIVKRDQNAFHILSRFINTGGKAKNRSYWRGSSPSPMRLRRKYCIGEID
ncbi:type IV secretion system protein VirB3 [Ruegeria sp. EL01]|uniref:type IV secretion system protein VirB3 n=1 Tax=Ruegeria sp. EL01 TaxID=2107578 RepID=UPI000EA81EB3|nr:type IV secretion system protein VirB3 [Ruegeria sp. EL01]